MAGHLEHEVAPRPVHPIKNEKMGAGFDAGERTRVARLDLDRADRIRLARVLRAVFAPRPWRMDTADEI